jgi:HAMP domain-containing protein
MTFYVVFLATVFTTLAVEITLLLYGPRVHGALSTVAVSGREEEVAAVVDLVALKVLVMLAILMVAIILVMTLFIKRVTIPLSRLTHAATAISEGDLSVTVPVETRDELAILGRHINELAANYQELLLLVDDLTRRAQELGRHGDEVSDEATRDVLQVLDELRDIVQDFGAAYYGAEDR